MDYAPIKEYCCSLSLPYCIRRANLARIVFETRPEENPCALCSHLRRGILVRLAREMDCNKLAYAHHADDAIETLLLNLFFTGRIASFLPVTDLSRQQLKVIRPFVYVREHLINKLADELNLPVLPNPCPAARRTQRQQVKEILVDLEARIPGLNQRLLSALSKKDIQLWPAPER
ncbi:MAG: ATP-binding protein [Syntrophomonadaceae bacterium]|nr:ATP-binding protein [Syntrophomonadaceae bacterium]